MCLPVPCSVFMYGHYELLLPLEMRSDFLGLCILGLARRDAAVSLKVPGQRFLGGDMFLMVMDS